ncbi:hypothetical protein HDU96_002830 [Phlyctochytrium bullatum]|nr:hypothetical protein HDU96_002830 [Phlyctochytrium bullatum]
MGTSTKRPISKNSLSNGIQPQDAAGSSGTSSDSAAGARGTPPSDKTPPVIGDAETEPPPPPASSALPSRVESFLLQLGHTKPTPETLDAFSGSILKDALSGDPRAMAVYGSLLQNGAGGVLQDEALGLAWLKSAASAPLTENAQIDRSVAGLNRWLIPHADLWSAKPPLSQNASGKGKAASKNFVLPNRNMTGPHAGVPEPSAPLSPLHMATILQVLGEAYRKGSGCQPDLNTAFRYMQDAVSLGLVDAMVGLAGMYERGDGVVRDEMAAFALFYQAAERGSVYAMFRVGQALERGRGTMVNYVQARHWYRQAAARNHFPSAVRLSLLSIDPACEPIELLEAAALQVKTARSFHDYAAALTTTHQGALPDARAVRAWFRRAAHAGHVRAQWLLGNAHVESARLAGGDAAEYRKAFYWYHAAALQGFQPAQWAVGNMYRAGQGVDRDPALADRWHRAASRSGMERCNTDPCDWAVVTVHSLTESVAPVWNAAEGRQPMMYGPSGPNSLVFSHGMVGVVGEAGAAYAPLMMQEDGIPLSPLAPGLVFANHSLPANYGAPDRVPTSPLSTRDPTKYHQDSESEGISSMEALLTALGQRHNSITINRMIYVTTVSALSTLNVGAQLGITGAAASPHPPGSNPQANGQPASAAAPTNVPSTPALSAAMAGMQAATQALSAMVSTSFAMANGVTAQGGSTPSTFPPGAGQSTAGMAAAAAASGPKPAASNGKQFLSPLHERSARSLTVSDILRHYPAHPTTALSILDSKKCMLGFEVYAAEGEFRHAVAELGECFRSMWGLFDHGNHALRLLAAVCVQAVLAELETAAALAAGRVGTGRERVKKREARDDDEDEEGMPAEEKKKEGKSKEGTGSDKGKEKEGGLGNAEMEQKPVQNGQEKQTGDLKEDSGTATNGAPDQDPTETDPSHSLYDDTFGHPEAGYGVWHEAALCDVFINMYSRTPEVSIIALDRIISDRNNAIARFKAANAPTDVSKTASNSSPPDPQNPILPSPNGTANKKRRTPAATTTGANPESKLAIQPSKSGATASSCDAFGTDSRDGGYGDGGRDTKWATAASRHQRFSPSVAHLEDPVPYLLRGTFKAKLGLWDTAVEDFNAAEQAEAKWCDRVPEIWYQRGVCYSNMPGAVCRERSIQDLLKFLSMVPVDHRRVPDAHYTIAGNHFALKNVRLVVDHFAKALEAEAVRFPFLPPIINGDLKTRLTLEVKYALVIGGTHVRSTPWSKVPPKVLRMVEGDEPANSIAKECLACHALGRTRTCSGCLTARYCSTNCQVYLSFPLQGVSLISLIKIAHWIRGHAQMCQMKKAQAFSPVDP